MSGDFARWAAAEITAALKFDLPRPSDPWACIPNCDQDYEGTPLELLPPDTECSGPACGTCNGTGIVQCAEQDGSGVYEQACPERVHDGQPCLICSDRGWVEGPGCNCGVGPAGYYGMHERHCGLEPCPRGCPFVAPGPARPQEEAPF